jgi:HEAT repeat protein
MPSTLAHALEALGSNQDLFVEDLRAFSDLDADGTTATAQAWPRLTVQRRREVIHRCGDLAREHIELNYDRLCLIALEDADPGVRQAAIANLWESEVPTVLRSLLTLLEADPEPSVRIESARALGRFVYQCEVDGLHSTLRERLETSLLMAAQDDKPELRARAVEALGYSSRPEVEALVEAAYADPDPASRKAAVVAMGRSGDPRWNAVVMAELRNPDPDMRREAARAVGELDLRSAATELTELLADARPDVQRQAISALGQIGGKTARRALERFAKGTDEPELAAAADEALEYLAFVESTRDLEAGLRSQEDEP